jgi:hypothetical protein
MTDAMITAIAGMEWEKQNAIKPVNPHPFILGFAAAYKIQTGVASSMYSRLALLEFLNAAIKNKSWYSYDEEIALKRLADVWQMPDKSLEEILEKI